MWCAYMHFGITWTRIGMYKWIKMVTSSWHRILIELQQQSPEHGPGHEKL